MTKKANLTEKHMEAIDCLRHKGCSWAGVQRNINRIFHLNHHPVTYMRKYKEWQMEGPSESTNIPALPKEKPGLWQKIKGFFGD